MTFNPGLAHKILRQQLQGFEDAATGRPKKRDFVGMVNRGGQREGKSHYESAYDNFIKGRDLRLDGKLLRARDRESRFRVLGYEMTDHLMSLLSGAVGETAPSPRTTCLATALEEPASSAQQSARSSAHHARTVPFEIPEGAIARFLSETKGWGVLRDGRIYIYSLKSGSWQLESKSFSADQMPTIQSDPRLVSFWGEDCIHGTEITEESIAHYIEALYDHQELDGTIPVPREPDPDSHPDIQAIWRDIVAGIEAAQASRPILRRSSVPFIAGHAFGSENKMAVLR